jgi:FixJ family two-component response regulator
LQASNRFAISVVDDDRDYREILRWNLESRGYAVTEFPDAESFIAGHDASTIGCHLIDYRLGIVDGIKAFKHVRLQGNDAPAIILSSQGDIPAAVQAVKLGAYTFFEKPNDFEPLMHLVAEACEVHQEHRQRHGSSIEALKCFKSLTLRESEVFWLIVEGNATKQIAQKLVISPRTVEAYRKSIFEKFECGNAKALFSASVHLKTIRLIEAEGRSDGL